MKKKSVSMADVAKRLGISKYAVSLALSGKKGVSDETRELVIKTCREMGYSFKQPRETSEAGKIGIIMPDYFLRDPYFFSDLLGAIEKEIRARGYSLILGAVSEESMATGLLPDLVTKNVLDGIIVISDIGERLFHSLSRTNIPLVVVDHFTRSLGIDAVMTDNSGGAFNAVIYLARCGLQKIGFIGDITSAVSYAERWSGYKRAHQELNLELRPEFCHTGDAEDRDAYELKRLKYLNGIKDFIDNLPELPEAFFCASNPATVILYQTLASRRVAIPADVSIIGFDDNDMIKMLEPPATMVHIDKAYYGQRAVEQLFYNIAHPDKPLEVIRISPELVIRHSVR